MISRRNFVVTGASGLLLGGCDRLNNSVRFRAALRSAEKLNMGAQRLVVPRNALAREYSEADMSPVFRSNGTANPGTAEYSRQLAENFVNWRLVVDGLVARPLSIPPTPCTKLCSPCRKAQPSMNNKRSPSPLLSNLQMKTSATAKRSANTAPT